MSHTNDNFYRKTKLICHKSDRYSVTIAITESIPETMTLSLASFAVSHMRVQFFAPAELINIDKKTGAIELIDPSKQIKMIMPIEVMGLFIVGIDGKKIEELSQLCPIAEVEGEDRIDEVTLSMLIDSIGSKWDKVKLYAYFPKWYFARSIKQLTRAEMKIVNAMSLNIMARLKDKDPAIAEEIMRLMNEDADVEDGIDDTKTSKTDTYLNFQISINHPELGEELREVQIKQLIKRMSFMIGLPVEMLQDIYDNIPNGVDIIDTIDGELRGIKPDPKKKEDGDDDAKPMTSKITVAGVAEVIEEEDDTEAETPTVVLPAHYRSAEPAEDDDEEGADDENPYLSEYDDAVYGSGDVDDSSDTAGDLDDNDHDIEDDNEGEIPQDEEEDTPEKSETVKATKRKVRRVKKSPASSDDDD